MKWLRRLAVILFVATAAGCAGTDWSRSENTSAPRTKYGFYPEDRWVTDPAVPHDGYQTHGLAPGFGIGP